MSDPAAVESFCGQEGISPQDTPRLLARWCVNPDRYACVRDARTPGQVLAAVSELCGGDPAGESPSVSSDARCFDRGGAVLALEAARPVNGVAHGMAPA